LIQGRCDWLGFVGRAQGTRELHKRTSDEKSEGQKKIENASKRWEGDGTVLIFVLTEVRLRMWTKYMWLALSSSDGIFSHSYLSLVP
jgi:hypothetical protein